MLFIRPVYNNRQVFKSKYFLYFIIDPAERAKLPRLNKRIPRVLEHSGKSGRATNPISSTRGRAYSQSVVNIRSA